MDDFNTKIVKNIIFYMDKLNIEIKNDKLEDYAKYLANHTGINKNRLIKFLKNENVVIKLKELYKISKVIGISLENLFKFEKK